MCYRCGQEKPRSEMDWTKDWHGIPFHYVCWNCFDNQQEEDFNNHYIAEEPIEPEY